MLDTKELLISELTWIISTGIDNVYVIKTIEKGAIFYDILPCVVQYCFDRKADPWHNPDGLARSIAHERGFEIDKEAGKIGLQGGSYPYLTETEIIKNLINYMISYMVALEGVIKDVKR